MSTGSFDMATLAADAAAASKGQTLGLLSNLLITPAVLSTGAWTKVDLPGFGNALWVPRYYYTEGTSEANGVNQNSPNQVVAVRLNSQNSQAYLMGRPLDFINAFVGSISAMWVKGVIPDSDGENPWVNMVLCFGVNVTIETSNLAAEAQGGDGLSVPSYSPGAGAGTVSGAGRGAASSVAPSPVRGRF
jgi:hypothetical protein